MCETGLVFIVDELFKIYVKVWKGNDLTEVINGYKMLWG